MQTTMTQAAQLLMDGELVVFPTETVYGLGARADSSSAVNKIYQLKNRPAYNPLIVHVASIEEARACTTSWSPTAETLAQAFWPGPLTLVLPASERVCLEARAGGVTVGVRIPQHPRALELLQSVKLPIAAPSANRSGHISPTCAAHVKASFREKTPPILDGGDCFLGVESTVVDLSQNSVTLLRPGRIGLDQIRAVVGKAVQFARAEGVLKSPGLLEKHYAPQLPLYLFHPEEMELVIQHIVKQKDKSVGWFSRQSDPPTRVTYIRRMPAGPADFARQLYTTFYDMESQNLDMAFMEAVPESSEWDDIRDRLQRASIQN